jgi:hypothetical protein
MCGSVSQSCGQRNQDGYVRRFLGPADLAETCTQVQICEDDRTKICVVPSDLR